MIRFNRKLKSRSQKNMDQENTLIVTKSRCPALSGTVMKKPGKEFAETFMTWLSSGATPPAPAPSSADAAGTTPSAQTSADAGKTQCKSLKAHFWAILQERYAELTGGEEFPRDLESSVLNEFIAILCELEPVAKMVLATGNVPRWGTEHGSDRMPPGDDGWESLEACF